MHAFMKRENQMDKYLKRIDKKLISIMNLLGHKIERYLLAIVFIWFGLLKLLGEKSATSIVAKSIYWMEPDFVVPILGVWEILIGVFLILKTPLRLAVLLLLLRLPGSFLALIYHFDECFSGSYFIPTIQGQYLIKELTLVGAALIIGSTIKLEQKPTN
jgi:uncharacterized membrane protein